MANPKINNMLIPNVSRIGGNREADVNRKTDSVTINMTIEVNDTKEISKVINLIRQMNDLISVARF